jgi:propionyl-CoA carboxylase alpha chain
VTECTTGLDLVELQLLVAAGGSLPAPALPAPALARGAAVEARLYAEDPAAGWQPATGVLHRVDIAAGHPAFTAPAPELAPSGVRLDSGVEDGTVIGVHYDPMLAKVIAWAPTRAQATAILAATLDSAVIHGPRTNRDLLVRVLRHPAFAGGDTDTGFLDRHGLSILAAPLADPAGERLAAVAAVLADAARRRATATALANVPSGWRNVPTSPQLAVLTGPAGEHEVAYRFTRDGVRLEGMTDVSVLSVTPETVVLEAGGLLRRWRVARYTGDGRLFVDGDTGSATFTEVPRFPEPEQAGAQGSLSAPLPGTVVALFVAVGDEVKAGQELLVIEAMKIQHVVRADRAGRVESLPAPAGSTVDVGAVLVVFAEVSQ